MLVLSVGSAIFVSHQTHHMSKRSDGCGTDSLFSIETTFAIQKSMQTGIHMLHKLSEYNGAMFKLNRNGVAVVQIDINCV